MVSKILGIPAYLLSLGILTLAVMKMNTNATKSTMPQCELHRTGMCDQGLCRTESNRQIGKNEFRKLPTLVHADPERVYIYLRQGLHYRPRESVCKKPDTSGTHLGAGQS